MGKRRKHLFILLFVFGLIVVSALVIVSKPTQLGLDLKGGVQLVYQRHADQQPTDDSGEDIDHSIDIIRYGCDQLGVSEIEVSRVGTDQIQVGIPDVTNVQRAIDQVGTTAQLFFYDWEPNLIGQEKAIGGHPGKEPPKGALTKANKEWKEAGRSTTKASDAQLLLAGAFPAEYNAVKLASEQEPVKTARPAASRPPYYLFSKKEPHELIDGPEFTKEDLYIDATGRTLPQGDDRGQSSCGHHRRLRKAHRCQRPGARERRTRLVRAEGPAGALGHRHHQPQAGSRRTPGTQRHLRIHRQRPPGLPGSHPQDRPARRRFGDRPDSADRRPTSSGHFAVVLDNEVKTRPIINYAQNPDGIDGRTGAQISGGFTSIAEAQELATFLQSGALPINLNLISQTQVSATLGTQALHDGIKAGLIGLILVVLFLLVFYRFLGFVATLALGAYGVIFFALIKLIPITLTLPGIAGLILTIGVAADSNIVIFERIKEEVRAGRSMSSAIAAGYRRGIATIIDANVVTLLTAFILFVLATAGVKGFAFTLGVGTIVSLLTAVVFTQALLGSMSRTRLLRSPSALGATRQGIRWHFDFMGASRWFFSISGVILLVGALSLATKQLNFGIDFESGTRVEVALEKPTDEDGVREALEKSASAAPRSSGCATRSSARTSSRSRPES